VTAEQVRALGVGARVVYLPDDVAGEVVAVDAVAVSVRWEDAESAQRLSTMPLAPLWRHVERRTRGEMWALGIDGKVRLVTR
jgi:hypothetical protein